MKEQKGDSEKYTWFPCKVHCAGLQWQRGLVMRVKGALNLCQLRFSRRRCLLSYVYFERIPKCYATRLEWQLPWEIVTPNASRQMVKYVAVRIWHYNIYSGHLDDSDAFKMFASLPSCVRCWLQLIWRSVVNAFGVTISHVSSRTSHDCTTKRHTAQPLPISTAVPLAPLLCSNKAWHCRKNVMSLLSKICCHALSVLCNKFSASPLNLIVTMLRTPHHLCHVPVCMMRYVLSAS